MDYLTYLYKFEVFIERVEINLRRQKVISIIWKKGKKMVETQRYSGYARGAIVIQQSLQLSLKLYKNPSTHEFMPKFSTFAVCEHEGQKRRVLMETKFNLLEMLIIPPNKDFALMFPHTEMSGKLIFKGKQQMVMELNKFRFNTQQLEESEGDINDQRELSDRPSASLYGEEELINLRKQIEDLNYLNGKLKNDREKLLLRVREVEFEFKQKQKLVLREIRHAKTYFEKKIKIRENIYQEEIQRLVMEANEQQATFARTQEQLREQIKELRAKLSKTQSNLFETRGENAKLRYELEEKVQQIKVASIEKAQEQQRVNEVIERLEGEIRRCQGELTSMVRHITDEKEEVTKEYGSKLQQLSCNLTQVIEEKLKEISNKDNRIQQMAIQMKHQNDLIAQLANVVVNVENLFSSSREYIIEAEVRASIIQKQNTAQKVQTLVAEKQSAVEKVQILLGQKQSTAHKVQSLLDQNKNTATNIQTLIKQKHQLQDVLKTTEEDLIKFRKMQIETQTKLEQAELDLMQKTEQFHGNTQLHKMRETNLDADLNELRGALELKHEEIYQIKEKERSLESDKEVLVLDIRKINQLRGLDSERITRVETENKQLIHKLDLKSNEVTLRDKELELKEGELTKLQNDLKIMELNKEEIQNELEKLKKALKNTEEHHEKKIEVLNKELQNSQQITKKDNRDATIESLQEQIKTKENDIVKLNKKNNQLSEAINKLMKKQQNNSADRDILAELARMNQMEQSQHEEVSGDIAENLRSQIVDLRKQIQLLKKQGELKDKAIKACERDHGDMKELSIKEISVGKLKQSIDRVDLQGADAMKKALIDKEKQFIRKEKELTIIKKEAEGRIDELEVQVQRYLLEIDEKNETIRNLTKKPSPNNKSDKNQSQELSMGPNTPNNKMKEVIKQLNKDHEAERTGLLKQIANLQAIIEQMRRSSHETPNKPRSSHGSAKDNFSFMPDGRLGSPNGGNNNDFKDRIRQLQKHLIASQTENKRLVGMVEDMEKHASIIRESPNELQPSEDSINNMLRTDRRKPTPSNRSPRSTTPPMQLQTVESEKAFKVRDNEIAELQSQLQRMRTNHEDQLNRLNKLNSDKENALKELQAQIVHFKEKQIQSKFIERESKLKDETISSDKEKRRELEAKLTEQINTRNLKIEKLEDQVRSFNAQYSSQLRELEKSKISIESKEREIAELKRSRDQISREMKQLRQSLARQTKKQYDDPAQAKLRQITKEVTRLRQHEYELRTQLERANQQRKDKYVKTSDHKDMKSELERIVKERTIECESLHRQLQESNQTKAKTEYSIRNLETELDELKRKMLKVQDDHKSIMEDKDADVRLMKKKMNSMERQQQQYQSKIAQLQERQKFLSHQHEKILDEMNKKIMQYIRESLIAKEQNQMLNDQVKNWKKRHSQVAKSVADLEDRLNIQLRQSDELKRAHQKLQKQLDQKQQQVNRAQQQIRKNTDEVRRQIVLKEDMEREKRQAEQQVQKLDKIINAQEIQIKRLTREVDKVKNKVVETEEDQFSSAKNIKLQFERYEQVRRKLEKLLEDRQHELNTTNHKLHKAEEEKKDVVDSLNVLYTDKLSLYVNQIDSIKKTIKEYEQEITYLKGQNRQANEELERDNARFSHLQTEFKICSESLDSKIIQLNFKREECDKVRQEKYEVQLINNKLSTEMAILTEDSRKLVEKLAKLADHNRSIGEQNQKLEMDVRVLKNNQNKLEFEIGNLRPYPDKCRELESYLKKLQSEREDIMEDIRHKNQLIYSQVDFERFQEQLKASLIRDKELEVKEALQRFKEESDQSNRKLQIEVVELMNESSRLRTDLERAKENNATILTENIRMIEYEKQAVELGKKVAELDALLKEKDRQMIELKATQEKSLRDVNITIVALEKDLQIAKTQRTQIQKQLLRGKKSQEQHTESLRRSEEKGMQILQKVNQDLRNKMMQIQFENSRMRENEIAIQGAYEKRILDIERRQQQKVKAIEVGYLESIHRYEAETERLKSMLDDLKYVLDDKNHQINFRRQEIDYYESQINKLNDQLKRSKNKANEQKEVYSLEIFKLGSRLKENDQQWGLKVKRLDEELARVTNQLVQTSSRVERELTYSKLKITDPDEKMSRKIEEKLKLKEKTIEELKEQILTLEEKIFKQEHEQMSRISDPVGVVNELRNENDKLREELRGLQFALKDTPTALRLEQQLSTLTDAMTGYKKQISKAKKTEQQLQEKIDSIMLQRDSATSQINFLRGYENSYKELKIQFEKVHQELRTIKAEGHSQCQAERDQLIQNKADLEDIIRDLQHKVSHLTNEKITRDSVSSKTESKEIESETATKIRESLNQYREELNKRQAILTNQMDVLKDRNSSLLEKVRKVESERDDLLRKMSSLNQTIAHVNEENLRYSQQIFRLNSNIMKEEFTQDDVREGLQTKWQTLQQITISAINMKLQEGIVVLIEAYRERQSLIQQMNSQRQYYENRLFQLSEQVTQMQQRMQIREEEFKFQRERDSLDIEQLTKETERLQSHINDLELEAQSRQNLEIEFERIEYDYNNCKILLDVCRAELEELRSTIQINEHTFVPKEQIVQDLEDILQKVHQR